MPSNTLTFTINAATPVITALSPSSATSGGPAFTLTVNGSGFLSGSVVDWNGSPLTTSYVNAGQLTASVTVGLIAASGTANITVVNPGGAASNTLTFTINAPTPVITGLSPSAATAGGPQFTLTVNGSGFLPGSLVLWNGLPQTTSYVSGSQLTASIPAGLIAVQGTAKITASGPGVTSNTLTFTINPPTAPSINAGGVVNGASFAAPVVPGSIASVFGGFLLTSTATDTNLPLSTSLLELSLQFGGGLQAPLFFVSGGQVNFQVPWELVNSEQGTISGTLNGQTGAAQTFSIAPFAPGIFTTNSQGTGQGAIQDSSYHLVDASNPATAGVTVVLIYCTGLGPVSIQPPTGSPASTEALSRAATTPTVTIGGADATVQFAGLAPGYVGLYQVNVVVPPNSTTGSAVPVTISSGTVTSNMVTIAVQ